MFLLHLHYTDIPLHQTLNFESAFLRGLWMITLTEQPVLMTVEDVATGTV